MGKELRFSTVLKELPVFLTGKDEVEKKCTLKELTGAQRALYNESFDVQIEMNEEGKAKAVAGAGFKSFSAKQFLALCLYDEKDMLIDEKIIGTYPSTMLAKLHEAALELSGLDRKALEASKNESKGSGSSGIE